jgi:cytochrome c556
MARFVYAGRTLAAAALIAFIVALAVPTAQQPPQQQGQQQGQQPQQRPQQPPAGQQPAPGTPPKPLVPVAASTVANDPNPYYGEYLTMTASVDQILSRTVFVVDQDPTKSTGKDVLVIVPTMNGKVDQNSYVTVIGQLIKYDPAEVSKKAKDYKSDITPEIEAKYAGKPVLIATSVINSSFIDVAKRLPPPMTADEESFQKIMKKIQPAFGALRTAVDESSVEKTTENTAILKQAFSETEAFWKGRSKADAMKWAQDARAQVETIERSAATAKWDAAKASAGTLGQACQTCHGTYRERFDDGSFRIKTDR